MLDQFKKYDEQNPQFWVLFVRFTFDLINRGFKHNSATAVCQRIRWETSASDYEQGKSWKVNNTHMPFYARKFMAFYPMYRGFFRTREQISKGMDAVDLPPLTPEDFPYENADQYRIEF